MRLTTGLLVFTVNVALSVNVLAQSQVKASTAANKKNQLVIASTIQGAQVQPNVIYITPWQELDTPVAIDEKVLPIVLPKFKPINPKAFKQQVKQHY